jgi:hypothetical protein
MVPQQARKGGGKGVLFALLGAGAAAAAVVLFFLLSAGRGGGGGSAAGLAAELPAGDRFEFVDLDAIDELGEEAVREFNSPPVALPRVLHDKLADLVPKGRRGVGALVRADAARVRVYCPQSLDEAALAKLLESSGFQKKSEGGAELWVQGTARGECVAASKGRIYSGDERLVKDVVQGKVAAERTMARCEGGRELLASASSSAAAVSLRKDSRGASSGSGKPRPTWMAQEIGASGSRVQARLLALYATAEDAEKGTKEFEGERPEMEARMKQGRNLPVKNAEFVSLDYARRGTLLVVTATLRRTAGGASPPGK